MWVELERPENTRALLFVCECYQSVLLDEGAATAGQERVCIAPSEIQASSQLSPCYVNLLKELHLKDEAKRGGFQALKKLCKCRVKGSNVSSAGRDALPPLPARSARTTSALTTATPNVHAATKREKYTTKGKSTTYLYSERYKIKGEKL